MNTLLLGVLLVSAFLLGKLQGGIIVTINHKQEEPPEPDNYNPSFGDPATKAWIDNHEGGEV